MLLGLGLLTFAGGLLTHHLAVGQEGQGTKSRAAGNKGRADAPKDRAKHQEKPGPSRYEDWEEVKEVSLTNRGAVHGTGSEKALFTVTLVDSAKGSSTFAFSIAIKETEVRSRSDFRILAVDGSGKRHPGTPPGGVTVWGNGVGIITRVPTFDLPADKIKSFVIQLGVP